MADLKKQLEESRARVEELEGRLKEQNDTATILRAAVANLTKRIEALESGGGGGTPVKAAKAGTRPSTARAGARTPTSGSASGRRPAATATARPTTARPAKSESKDAKSPKPEKKAGGTALTVDKKEAKKGAKQPKVSEKKEEKKRDAGSKEFYYVGKKKVPIIIPDEFKEYKDTKEASAAPRPSLALEYVYGYNGKSARENLYYINDGAEFVYCVAGTAVIMDPATGAQRFFTEHNEDIASLDVHPNKTTVATGQIDPKGSEKPFVLIWDQKTMKRITRIDYHERGIIAVAFSPDGDKLITIGNDDEHSGAVWDWSMDTKKPLLTQRLSKDKVFGCNFDPYTKSPGKQDGTLFQFAVYGQKCIKFLRAERKGGQVLMKSVKPATSGVTDNNLVEEGYLCCLFLADGQALVGGQSGLLYLFDKDNKAVKSFKAHESAAVSCIRAMPDGGFVTGGFDNKLVIWKSDFTPATTIDLKAAPRAIDYAGDGKTGKVIVGTKDNQIIEVTLADGAINNLMKGHTNEIWALAVHPNNKRFAVGAHDKVLRVWDYETKKPLLEKKFKEEVRTAAFSPDGKSLAVGFKDGTVAVMDGAGEVVQKKKFRKEIIDCLSYSPDGNLLAAGSWDQMVSIVDTKTFKQTQQLKGHTSSIEELSWSADSKVLMTNSKDYEILYWNVADGKRLGSAPTDAKWSNWTCKLGWCVRGIWANVSDGTDINTVAISGAEAKNRIVATGDDFGRVSIYRYPCIVEKPAAKVYMGHSSHVTRVRFTSGSADSHLITCGGGDTAVFQWRVVGAGESTETKESEPSASSSAAATSDAPPAQSPAAEATPATTAAPTEAAPTS